jgi:steroid delta-isomerase-like uncharacterized protein
MQATSDQHKLVIKATVEAWNRHDLDALGKYFEPDVVLERPGFESPLKGLPAFRKFDEDFLAAFPDARSEIRTLISEGDTVILEFLMRGHQTGTFKMHPPTGKEISIPIVEIFTFKKGKISTVRRYLDTAAYAQQLNWPVH